MRFTDQYGDLPSQDWAAAVDKADDQTVQRGLALIRQRYLDHPPTLPQFEQCMAVPRAAKGPTIAEQLTELAMRRYGARLTRKQFLEHWTYSNGSLSIPADGDNPGFRVTHDDLMSSLSA